MCVFRWLPCDVLLGSFIKRVWFVTPGLHRIGRVSVLIVFLVFSVDDVYAVSDKLEKAGCDFQKKPDEGKSNDKADKRRKCNQQQRLWF